MDSLPFGGIKRQVVKKTNDSPGKYGFYPEKRPILYYIKYGMVNLDKPSGPTSHQVSSWVKKILKIKKAGHSGTLDPNVTGVLPIGLEKSTKILSFLLKAGKEYIGVMKLHRKATEKQITRTMNEFVGEIMQKPPVRSNVKRVKRKRTIYYLDILEIKNKDILFKTGVEAGTYIRKLCDDIGRELNTGAHMAELRRTRVGPFSEKDSITLHDLKDAWHYFKQGEENELRKCIVPIEKGVEHLGKIWVSDPAVATISHGAKLAVPGIAKFHTKIKKGDWVALMSLKNELVSVGKCLMNSKEIKEKQKGLAVDTKRVIMPPGIYKKDGK